MSTNNETIDLKGSCLCGAHSYKATGELLGFYHCHCSRCQKATGTGHASNILLKPAELELAGDRERIGVFKVPDAACFASRFCRECGGPLPRYDRKAQLVAVPAGTLDEPTNLEPQCRVFWESRSSWSCGDKKLPKFAEYPVRN